MSVVCLRVLNEQTFKAIPDYSVPDLDSFIKPKIILISIANMKFSHFEEESMKKVARKWRRTRREEDDKFVLPTSDDVDSRPIDIQEQEEYVRSLEEAHAHQSRQWRIVFAVLLFCYAAFLFYSIFQQFMSPWEMRYHAYFMEDLKSWMVISAEWIAIMACCLSIVGLQDKKNDHSRWFWYSCVPGSALTIFWLYYLLRLPKFRWDAIWLPFGPLCGAGTCLYVDHLLEESSEEVKKLRNYMYAYKAR